MKLFSVEKTIVIAKSRTLSASWTMELAPWENQMEKVHYQHFLRLNNRRKTQKISNIDEAGYTCVKLTVGWREQREWCKKNLKPGSYINLHTRFWFAYDRDATLFTLRWSQ